jgi:hypothetical protein
MRIGSASSKFSSVAPLPFRRAGLGGAKSFASEHALAEPLERPRALFGERIDLLATVEREGHLSGKPTSRTCEMRLWAESRAMIGAFG